MNKPTSPDRLTPGGGDPWAAFGYLVAGVAFYGFLGWALGRWLHASYLTPVGILVGAGLGLALVFHQFGRAPRADDDPNATTPTAITPTATSTTPRPESTQPVLPGPSVRHSESTDEERGETE